MKGIQDIIFGLRAGYAFFYVQTYEMVTHAENLLEAIENYVSEASGEQIFSTYLWDLETAGEDDPSSLIRELDAMDLRTVAVAKNFHWFLKDFSGEVNKELVQAIINRTEAYTSKERRKSLIILGSDPFENAIPDCLQKDFLPVEMELPQEEEISIMLDKICESAQKANPEKFQMPDENQKELIKLNSRGLTKREIVNAYSFSIIKDSGKLDPETVGDIQAKEISTTPGLSIGKFKVEEPLGMRELKKFVSKSYMTRIGQKLAKGLMLLGPPGTGKTHFAKWVGMILGLKLIVCELSEIFGSLVGESEKNIKKMIDVISANAPCVVLIDEIEKGLAGMSKQGSASTGDGGVTERAMSVLLKFLSDARPEGVIILATCNNIEKLPSAWVRAERWDCAPFYIGLPEEEDQEAILKFYKKKYNVEGKPSSMLGWSGAEIHSVCRIAAMMEKDISHSEKFIIPVSKTMESEISYLEKWAKGKCNPASMKFEGKKKVARDLDL